MAERRIKITIDGYKEASNALKAVYDIEQKLTKIEKERSKQEQEATNQQKSRNAAVKSSIDLDKAKSSAIKERENAEKAFNQAQKERANAEKATYQAESARLTLEAKLEKQERDLENQTKRNRDATLAWAVAIANNLVNRGLNVLTRSLRDALKELRAVDDELVTIRKVTDMNATQLDSLTQKAFKIASSYGVSASEYLASVASFSRAGYGDMADELAELSVKTQIVGDTTEEIADQFLLSMNAAYKYGGSIKELTKVLDGANEIDNKFATTIEKIASGLGIIAPVAALTNTPEAEITAAIGTITAVTQRSGTEAARALRALWLSIVKDTTTEIDEGETVTQEAIDSISDALNKYASESVKAAQAAGKVINPMEALISLNKAYKADLLTEQELTNILFKLGGKLRASQLVALVQNIEMYEDMLDAYKNASGSADKEVSNAMDSWSRKTKQLKNEWAELVQNTISSGVVKSLIDVARSVVDFADNLGLVITQATALIAILQANKVQEIWNGIVGTFRLLSGTMDAAKISAASLSATLGVVTLGVTLGIQALISYKEHSEEAQKKAVENAISVKEEHDELVALYDKYREIYTQYKNGTTSKESYETATKNITDALKLEKDKVDALSGSYETLAENIKTATEEEIRSEILKTRVGLKAAREQASLDSGAFPNRIYLMALRNLGLSGGEMTGDEYAKVLQYAEEKSLGNGEYKKDYENLAVSLEPHVENIKLLETQLEELEKALNDVKKGTTDLETEQRLANEKFVDADEIIKKASESYKILADAQKSVDEEGYLTIDAVDKIKETFGEENEYLEKTEQGYRLAADALDIYIQKQVESSNLIDRVNSIADREHLAANTRIEDIKRETEAILARYKMRLKDLEAKWAELNLDDALASAEASNYQEKIREAESILASISAYEFAGNQLFRTYGSRASSKSSDNAKNEAKKKAQADKKAEIDAIQAQIDALKATKKSQDDNNSIEEKQLAVEEAELALLNEQNERNVRYYNASTGQWEWEANRKAVDDAKENLEKAREALDKEIERQQYEAQLAELEALKQAAEDKWDAIIDEIENGTKEIVGAINSSNGGGYHTSANEDGSKEKPNNTGVVLVSSGADKASAIATKKNGTGIFDYAYGLDDLGLAAVSGTIPLSTEPKAILKALGTSRNAMQAAIGTQNNGDTYQFGGISISQQEAMTTSVWQMAQLAKGLAIHNN